MQRSIPQHLGKRRRGMALLLALAGLTTFVVPLIGTDPPVLQQAWWSPLAIIEATQAGRLPLGMPAAAVTAADLAVQYFDWLYGFLFAYGMLAVAFLAIIVGASIRTIRWATALCLVLILADVAFGHIAYRTAFYAGGDGPAIHAGMQSAILLGIAVLLLAIASLEELD